MASSSKSAPRSSLTTRPKSSVSTPNQSPSGASVSQPSSLIQFAPVGCLVKRDECCPFGVVHGRLRGPIGECRGAGPRGQTRLKRSLYDGTPGVEAECLAQAINRCVVLTADEVKHSQVVVGRSSKLVAPLTQLLTRFAHLDAVPCGRKCSFVVSYFQRCVGDGKHALVGIKKRSATSPLYRGRSIRDISCAV